MYKTSTELKVGIFVLIILTLMIFIALRLGGLGFSKSEVYELSAVFETAGGLKTGVTVEVAGIQVGHVKSIRLLENQAEVYITVSKGVQIPQDSQALIRTQGVLGDKFLEIIPGFDKENILKNNARIAKTLSPTDMGMLLEKINSIADDIKEVTSALATEDGGGDLRRTIKNFSEFSENLSVFFNANQNDLSGAISSFHQSAQNFESSMASLRSITDKVDSGLGSLGQLINSNKTVNELDGALSEIRQITSKINAGEGTIGKLVKDDSTVKKLDEALVGFNKFFTKSDSFKIYVDYYGDFMTRHDYFKSTVNIRIQPSADTYYLLGVTNDYFGKYKRKDRYDNVGGAIRKSTEESWDRGKLKFNAQIAKRYYDLVIRAGLFESGGGIGFDYYLLEDQLKVSMEVFGSDFDYNPNIRLRADYNFWKMFYVSLGYDEIISERNRSSPFVGIGLKFSDDDLKYLLSNVGGLK